MADNVAITAGAGTTIATDDVGGAHYQRMKLVSAVDGDTEPYGDDDMGSARALWVRPRVDAKVETVASAGLTTATTAYSVGDVLGTGWEFPNFFREAGGVTLLKGITILDISDVLTTTAFFFAGESVTFGTDNAALAIADAEAQKIQLYASQGALVDIGGSRVLTTLYAGGVPLKGVGTSLFVYATTGSANAVFAAGVGSIRVTLLYERQ